MSRTDRFEIHKTVVTRPAEHGGSTRTMFHAWMLSEDVPRPVVVVTVWEQFDNYVEWIYVEDQFRRKGFATEVLREIERQIGPLTIEGVTPEGKELERSYYKAVPA